MPVVATNDDNRLEVFMVGRDRQLHHRWQTDNPYHNTEVWNNKWESLGGDWPSIPVVGRVPAIHDGTIIGDCLEVFMVGRDRQLYHRWQTQPNGGWNNKWESLGGDWPNNPVIHREGFRLKIFLVGQDRQLYYGSQDNIDSPVNISSLGGDWPDVQ